jgi:hypothetical protein
LTPSCNGTFSATAGVVILTNEQSCDATTGQLTVNGVHVTAPIDVILAQSKAGAKGCSCKACTPGSVSAPPCNAPNTGTQLTCTPTTSC